VTKLSSIVHLCDYCVAKSIEALLSPLKVWRNATGRGRRICEIRSSGANGAAKGVFFFFDNKQLYRLCSHITYQTFEEVCITDRSNDQNAAATTTTTKTNTPAES
jgi:hypothetical protein